MPIDRLPRARRWTRTVPRILPFILLAVSLSCSLPFRGRQTPTAPAPTQAPVPTAPPTATTAPLPPALAEIFPPEGSEVRLDQPVTLYFNQAMDRSSVEQALQAPAGVEARLAWKDSATLTWTPTQPLAPGEQVSFSLGTGARSQRGLALSQPLSLTFQTVGYLHLAQSIPEPDAQEVDPTSAVVATFNRPVVPLGADPSGLPAAFTLEPGVSGSGEWVNTSTYIFYPQPALPGGVPISVQVNPDLHGADGSPLESAASWTFTTALPALVSASPQDGAGQVALDSAILLTFNQPMNTASVQPAFHLLDPGGAAVNGSFSWNEINTTLTFTPTNLLERDAVYTIRVESGALAASGAALEPGVEARFRTAPPLTVTSSNPLPNGILPGFGGIELILPTPLDDKDLTSYLSISPTVTGLWAYWSDWEDTLRVSAEFEPDHAYTLQVSPELHDVWGGRLGEPYTLPFRTPHLDPAFQLLAPTDPIFLTPQDASLPASVTNLETLPISVGSVPLDDFIRMFGNMGYEFRQSYEAAGAQAWTQSLDVAPDKNQSMELYLSPNHAPLPPGLYALKVSPNVANLSTTPSLLVVSNIQMTLKLSNTEAFVWAVDLPGNQPAANVPITIYAESGETLASGSTDADGVFQADIPVQENTYSSYFAVAGQPGDANFSLVYSWWTQGLGGWDFGISSDSRPPRLEAYLYTDRPIYRPDQVVYFRAVVRQAFNGRYSLPDLATFPITLTNEMGEVVETFDLPLTNFGTAHGEFHLPANISPGVYSLLSSLTPNSGLSFKVAEYRKPEINLQVAFNTEQARQGAPLTAQVTARYFFDAPAGNVKIHWSLMKAPSFFDLPGYQTGVEDTRWIEGYLFPQLYDSFGAEVAQGDSVTQPDGTLVIEIPAELTGEDEPGKAGRQRFTLEVTATDESGLPVSNRATVEMHPASFYIGVRPDAWVGRAGEPLSFEIQVADWNRKPASAHWLRSVFQTVEYVRQESNQVNRFDVPLYVPKYGPESSTDFQTNDQGQARIAFTPAEPGTYRMLVTGMEPGEEGARTEMIVWVGGAGQAVWPTLPNQHLRLTADRDAYRPGDTAQVFIPNPFGVPVLALATVERAVVMRHQVFTLEAGGSSLDFDLSAEDAPNVIISVTLLGRQADGRPDFRFGMVELQVEPVEQTLNVTLTSQPQHAGPGDEVTFEVLVTDSAGQPVMGEFSLAVIDLAVLALADPNAPQIVPALYSPQPLGVRTMMGLAAYGHRLVAFAGGGGGGGGEMVAAVVREHFPDTAYWNAEITTGPDGKARVTVPLPDSLTTWQVDLRGITADSRAGQATTQVVATKDLLIRPVTPRFLVTGDHVLLAAVANNNTAGDLTVEVSLQASGFSLDDPATTVQQVSVPAGGRARVEWWGTVQDVGSADLVFAASSARLADAARPQGGLLPVLHYTARQTFRTSGALDEGGSRLELVSLPRSFDPAGGELKVELAPSLASATMNALEALETFPYECTEQTLSRFLPNLETYRALQQFGIEAPALDERLDRTLNEGLQRLLALQNDDGGWSWWQSGESDPLITTYVVFGFSRALQAGVTIRSEVMVKAVEYLNTHLQDTLQAASPQPGELDQAAFAAFAILEASQSVPELAATQYETGPSDTLFKLRNQLSPWAQAFLAMTLDRRPSASQAAQTLFSDLESKAVRSATGVHWEADSADARNMISTVSNTAIVVYALAQRDPGAPLLADAARYLVASRGAEGAWGSTYATAWSLMALTEFMKGTGELGGDFDFSASLNGSPVASGQAGGPGQLTPVEASIPLEDLAASAPNALVIQREPGAGRLYYTAGLNLSRPVESVAPLQAGLSVSRLYYPSTRECLEGGCAPIDAANAGELVSVRLSLTLPNDAYYLIVEDYLPAGAEVLDTSLKTSQQGIEQGPLFDPRRPFADGWGWWWFQDPQVFDDHIAWAASYLPAGSYELTYTLALLQPGEYRVLPARAWMFYFPEVQANSAGTVFKIR